MLHHTLGASTCERWSACPGSVVLSKNAPQLPPSKYAAQGTAAHMACEILLRGESLLQTEITVDGFTFYVSDTDDNENSVCLEYVRQYVDYVRMRVAETGGRLLIEQRVNIPNTDLFGTADALIVAPYDCLEVIDFKYGRGVRVSANGNKQLRYYGTAAFLALPVAVQAEIPKIISTIVQPRTGAGIETETYTPNDAAEFYEWVMASKAEVARAEQIYCSSDYIGDWESQFLHPGSHCRWCPANPTCPVVQNHAIEIVKGDAKVDFAGDFTRSEAVLPDPEHLSVNALLNIFHNGDTVKDYIDKCRALLNIKAKNGEVNPEHIGLKFVQGVKRRQWKNEQDVSDFLRANSAKPAYVYMTEPKLKSPYQIEKEVEPELKEQIKALAYKPAGEVFLAPIDDKRPAVSYSKPADDFKDEILEMQLAKSIENMVQ